MKAEMHVFDEFWDLRIGECPCDVDFIAWVDANRLEDAAIFHFGTGGHHHVGLECARPERRNAVLGITASPQEYETYMRLVIEQPRVGLSYKVLFGDIYLLHPQLLPVFDVVTLFHLCEYRSHANEAYGALTDLEVTNLLTDRVHPGGFLLFYKGSNNFDDALGVIASWEEARNVERAGEFKTLLIYRKIG